MSDIREELLGGGVDKKRVMGVILVALLLVSVFAFSTVFFSFLFGTQRDKFNKRYEGTEYEWADPTPGEYPFDEDFWQDLLDQVDPEDLPELLDMLEEMFDGDIDDLDLGNFSEGLLEFLFGAGAGEIEVFRVYNYSSIVDMADVLWKFECFDQYTGTGWESTAGSDLYSFCLDEYYDRPVPRPDLLRIKMPISPVIGPNNMILPSLFPIPFIMEGSVSAPNSIPGTEQLYKTDFNCTTLSLSFSSDVDVNMSYKLFGEPLKSPLTINNSAVEASWTPAPIQSQYLQLPPSIPIYLANNPYFLNHTNILNQTLIDSDDNAFEVADKIRIYLQTQFSFPMTPDDYNPAPDGTDVVEWFCETQQGIWSDFASAFCAFTRVFGVSSRFVDGFNSFMIEEVIDTIEGLPTFAIKYKNLYNWAEIYVPTDVSGVGEWVQMDIFDSFGGGGNPIVGGNYNITVTADKYFVNRPDVINIIASMTSDVGDPIDNNRITFTDLTTGQQIGQDDTDSFGNASVLYNINDTHVVGPHIIEARYDFFTAGGNIITILGAIGVNLTGINPILVNRSDVLPDTVHIQGVLYDPVNDERVTDASVNILLFQKGTSIQEFGAFSPPSILTDSNGVFNDYLDLSLSVSAGQYEVRADFNGTWIFYGIPWNVPIINDSSSRMGLNITTALITWFYIEGIASDNPNLPSVSRTQTINLTARVIEESFGPVSNRRVYFYDYTRGDVEIGFADSNPQGYASIDYFIGDYSLVGPNLLYSMIGSQMNYSYYVLNEEPIINTISGPIPRIINRTGSGATQFNIVGNISDRVNTSRPLSFSEITLKLLKDGSDYSSYLAPLESYPYQTGLMGYFDLTFGVAPNTPPGNYTLRVDFNGTIDLMSYPYQNIFNLPYINTSSFYNFELQIDADSSLLFWIDGFSSDDPNNPIVNRGDLLNLIAYIHQAGTPVTDGEWVYFYDVTQDNLFIGADQTSAGYAQVFYPTNWNTTSGPHLIYATWNNRFNYSYFIFDAPLNVTLDPGPQPRAINRSGSVGTTFTIHGYLTDSSNGNIIKYGEIEVRLYDGPSDVSFYLNEPRFVQLGTSGEIDLIYSVSASTPAINYTLQVLCNGIFIYTNPNYPQSFNLGFLSNFTYSVNASYQLEVRDPDDINIFFFIDGNPTLSFYSDGQPPERYTRGATINFSVFITRGVIPQDYGTVSFIDIFTGTPLGNPSVVNGYASILVDSTLWHAGLHRIRVQWSGSAAFNTTYVVINETVNVYSLIDDASILRFIDSFLVSGTVQEGGELLRGLEVNLVLLDGSYSDVSGYLIGPQALVTNAVGAYQFDNSIDITCPQGQYYIRIDFNGTIDAPGIFMTDYMIHNSSLLIPIDIIAGTSLSGNYETNVVKDDWYYGDDCYVYGYLTWDDGTPMAGMEINVTIRDGTGAILATQTWTTTPSGFFNVTFTVGDWPDNTEVWVYFYPEDPINFGVPDGYYILTIQQEFFRAP
ncbi:MAG: transglutaminase domain-containing protein [Promethearchaeota archaeon]